MLKLYNTLTKEIEEFKSIETGKVKMYCCGPTVYNYAHIGNLRTYIFEDILKRTLKFNGYEVKHVINVTDVGHLVSDADDGDDKMEMVAKKQNKTAWEIAKFYFEQFKKDLKELNIQEPNIWCKATDHIKEQIEFVKELEKKGVTYKIDDGIYFDTSKLKDYGKLAGNQIIENNIARIEYNTQKKNPTDFALWKFSPTDKQRQMEWESPWGKGFPGWHIECSAMATKYLGEHFDIHCGGIDHIPVHHTNEIAQAETILEHKWVNYWLHGEFLVVNKNEKMAKSGENFVTVETLINKNINPLIYRFYCLGVNYRKQLTFTWEAMKDAENSYNNLKTKIINIKEKLTLVECNPNEKYIEKFKNAINEDLNMPVALAVMWEIINENELTPDEKYKTLLKIDEVLGLKISEIKKDIIEIPNEILDMLEERNKARTQKDFKKADEIRNKLTELGYVLDDTKDGTNIRKI